MTETAAPPDLATWLTSRTDTELVGLLTLRPDLTVPPPSTIEVLAGRAEQRASILRSADSLDTLALTILELLSIEGAHEIPVTRAQLDSGVSGRASAKAVDAALTALRDRALVWGQRTLRMTPAARDAVPWRIGRILDSADQLAPDAVTAALATLDDKERGLLDTLARSSPVGRTRDAAPGTSADKPVQKLLHSGLLTWLDEQTVELPHQVGQALRGEPMSDPTSLKAPKPQTSKHPLSDVNAAAAGETLELVRHCAAVIDSLSVAPAPALKAGGLGIRELKRITKVTGLDEKQVSLLVELLAAASLISSGTPDPLPSNDSGEDYWAPTSAVEGWIVATPSARWHAIAASWLDLQRAPWLIGMRDPNDKPVAALSEEVRSPAAPRDRRAILDYLAGLGPGTATTPTEVSRGLAWQRPRSAARFSPRTVQRMLDEATTLGIVARGALSSPGRALLHGGDAEAAMRQALPAPVDHILLQADLTLVAPGPLEPDLHDRIQLVADVESAGAATMYRITEHSLRRALDVGMSAAELHSLFSVHSRTPVPQGLSYLIDDVARRHGRLRAGVASSFVRCEDPALLAEVLTSAAAEQLGLRALAPTVAISQASLVEVMNVLGTAGFAPAGEDANGAIVDLRSRGARVPLRRTRANFRNPAVPTDDQLGRLVTELRAGDRASKTGGEKVRSDGTRATGTATLALLQTAVKVKRSVTIGYVDAQGTASQRVVDPVGIGGGQLDAFDPATGEIRRFTLHRITSVALV